MNNIPIKKKHSNSMVVRLLGSRIKQYRIAYRLTQKEMSEQTGINVVTLRKFENGQSYNIGLNSFIAIMRVLDKVEKFDELLPPMGMSVYEEEKILNKRPKRVKHANKNIESDTMGD